MEPWIKSASKEICKFWLEGDCLRPEGECAFAHSGEVIKLPEVCKFYRDNSKGKTCVKGKACRFLHETYPCVDFLLGRCEFSTDCKFSHEPFDEEMKKSVQKVGVLTTLLSDVAFSPDPRCCGGAVVGVL